MIAPPFTFSNDTRKTLIDTILRDLKATAKHGTSNGRLSSKGAASVLCLSFPAYPPQDAAQALLAVKTLGKNPSGSETLATASTLSALLGLSISFKDDPEASSEALRCIANTMLLFEHARGTFIGKDVGGGETCVGMLDVSPCSLSFSLPLIFYVEIDDAGSSLHSVAHIVLGDGVGPVLDRFAR